MNWPIYYKDVLSIGNPKSNVGICTLWTPKNQILDELKTANYALGGQLYSKRGINFIVRNILANPVINKIVLCGTDRSESGEAFMKFMKNGIDDDYRVVGDKKCEIQKEIDKSVIEDFRKNVEVIDVRGKTDISQIADRLISKSAKPWAKPRKFNESVFSAAEKFPSEKSTFNIRADYIWEAWVQILRKIMKFGSRKGMIKIGEIKELVNVVTVVEKEGPYDPELSDVFDFSKKDLEIYYKDFFNPSKGSESYNYGERIYSYPVGLPIGEFNAEKNQKLLRKLSAVSNQRSVKSGLDQLEEVYDKFKRYHEDRGMVVAIWNPWVDNVKEGWMSDKKQTAYSKQQTVNNQEQKAGSGNVPCMALLQFTYRSKKLHLTAYFRSNDMFDAWPRNAFALRKLQFDFAERIGKKPGYLTTISNCAQIYESNYAKASKIISRYKNRVFCRPDPMSTVIIEIQGKEIVARHMTPDGNKQLDEYRIDGTLSKAALRLMDKLMSNDVFSTDGHVADIASELTKAEWCLKNGKIYIQDTDWKEIGK
ncbi:MAG: thymidylate synthase [Patescibacteria group bacterium]|nr:hypothetical protein [Patescibacteria group bacterium]